jgi:hypothetical protein
MDTMGWATNFCGASQSERKSTTEDKEYEPSKKRSQDAARAHTSY